MCKKRIHDFILNIKNNIQNLMSDNKSNIKDIACKELSTGMKKVIFKK